MSPPAAFASSAHRTRPLRYSAAAAACEPVSEMTAPTTSAPSWAATAEVGHRLLAHVRDAHAGDDGEGQRRVDERALEFGAGAVHRIDVQRMLVHGEERKPDVVRLGQRAP